MAKLSVYFHRGKRGQQKFMKKRGGMEEKIGRRIKRGFAGAKRIKSK
jgi:hypothetical protein